MCESLQGEVSPHSGKSASIFTLLHSLGLGLGRVGLISPQHLPTSFSVEGWSSVVTLAGDGFLSSQEA